MKYANEPTYAKYITGELKRFDERNTGFSRGAAEGDLYTLMHEKSVRNMERMAPGKTVFDHARWVSGRTVDYILRQNALAREGAPIYNAKLKLKNTDPVKLSQIIKETALWLGADLVGVAELNPLWIYTHWGLHNVMYTNAASEGDPIDIPPEYRYVVVMINEMDYKPIHLTPAVEYETDIMYSKMGWCATSLATFIRELGYRAIPSGNELGMSIPMAVDAGLGELGRHGLLITREFGPRVRISKVFTDLPLSPDRPIDIGIQKFCEVCKLCSKYCPSRALTSGPRMDTAWDVSNSPGMLKWPVRAMKCLNWWAKNGCHCSVCIRVCPWNKPNNLLHKIVRSIAELGSFNRTIVYLDQILGYGRQIKKTIEHDTEVVPVEDITDKNQRPPAELGV